MSAAEKLTRAAAVLRERAEAATPGPWRSTGRAVRSGRSTEPLIRAGQAIAMTSSAHPFRPDCPWHAETPEEQREPDAAYIATVSPPFALAVAHALDCAASDWEYAVESSPNSRETAELAADANARSMLAVASAVLGEDAGGDGR